MNLEMVIIMDWKENQLMIPDQTNITFSFVIISPQKLTFSGHVISVDDELGQNYYSWQNCLKKKKKAMDRVDGSRRLQNSLCKSHRVLLEKS